MSNKTFTLQEFLHQFPETKQELVKLGLDLTDSDYVVKVSPLGFLEIGYKNDDWLISN